MKTSFRSEKVQAAMKQLQKQQKSGRDNIKQNKIARTGKHLNESTEG